MVKNIFIIFGILISIFLMLVISLHNGIKIDNISFKNINIQGLYLKYDKKLIIDTRSVAIGYLGNTKSVDMKIKFSIENFFDNYYIEVDEYVLFDPYLKASGKFVLDLSQLSLESILKDVQINDFSLQFNSNLKFITAQSCFVTFKDNNFYFSFEKPVYEGVSLEGSKATIINLERLKLELTSQDKLKKPLLGLLSNYQINLPIIQEYGTNTIFTELEIPFDIKKELKVQSNIALENSKIYLYDIPLYMKNFNIFLDNTSLVGSGQLYKIKENNDTLEYDLDVVFDIDFKKNIVQGDFVGQSIYFEDIDLEKTNGKFSLDFNKSDFISDIILNNGRLKIKDEIFRIEASQSTYKDKDKTFYSNLNLTNTQYPATLKIDDAFHLLDINSKGNIEFYYKNKDTKLFSKSINYQGNYNNDNTIIDILIDDLTGTILNNTIDVKHTKLQYFNGIIEGDVKNLSVTNSFMELNNQNINLDYNTQNNKILNVDMNNSKLLVNNIDIGLKKNQLQYQKNRLNINSIVKNKYSNLVIKTNIDLLNKNIKGDIEVANSNKARKDDLKYTIDYKKDITMSIPKIDFKLKKTQDNFTTISVSNLLPLKNYFDFVKIDNKSRFLLTRDNNANTNINLDHISVVLDDYYSILQKDKEKKINNENINVYWKNSFVEFNNFNFYFDKANLQIVKENLHLQLQKDITNITIDKISDNTVIKSKKVDANYVNLVFGKEVLKEGYLELFLTGGYNLYQGDIKLYKTTIVQMQLVDNLLLFLNTTPALINPLLAIPTAYRMIENKFELGGYYMEDGIVRFNYNGLNKYLDMYNITTNGKINDFSGNIKLNFLENTVEGILQVSTLKDYAKIIDNIPVINFLFLDKDGQFSIPISLYGTIDNPNYKVLNK